jgi:hypothetical protein
LLAFFSVRFIPQLAVAGIRWLWSLFTVRTAGQAVPAKGGSNL